MGNFVQVVHFTSPVPGVILILSHDSAEVPDAACPERDFATSSVKTRVPRHRRLPCLCLRGWVVGRDSGPRSHEGRFFVVRTRRSEKTNRQEENPRET